jgi:hypothetical protein
MWFWPILRIHVRSYCNDVGIAAKPNTAEDTINKRWYNIHAAENMLRSAYLCHLYPQLSDVKAELKRAESMLNMVGDPMEAKNRQQRDNMLEVGNSLVQLGALVLGSKRYRWCQISPFRHE